MKNNWFAAQGNAFQQAEAPNDEVSCKELFTAAKGFITILDDQTALAFQPVRNK